MRKISFVFLFILSMSCKLYAQYQFDASDTLFSPKGVMLYLSGSSAFPIGGLYVPQTELEYGAFPQPTNRVSTTGQAGLGYSAGFEFLCNSYCNAFTVIDLGVASYTYNIAVTDATYSVSYTPPTTIYTGNVGDIINYRCTMFDISLYRFHNLLNTAKDKLSAGLGFKIGYIFSKDISDNYVDDYYESSWFVPFISAALRYDLIEHKRALISMGLYFNCGYMYSNGLVSAGVRIGFNLK